LTKKEKEKKTLSYSTYPISQSQLIEFPAIFKSIKNTLSGIFGISAVFGFGILFSWLLLLRKSSERL